jgi:Ca2+-binding RTX toxin-like protein
MGFSVISTDQNSSYNIYNDSIVTLLEGVTVSSAEDGFLGRDNGSDALSDVQLNILGTVITAEDGVEFEFYPELVSNTDIFVGASGQIISGGRGIAIAGANNVTITNDGSIYADNLGISISFGFNEPNQDATVNNSGTITSELGSAILGRVDGTAYVINSGTLTGAGTDFYATISMTVQLDLVNSGNIFAIKGNAIETDHDSDSILNTGFIGGDVHLKAGHDTITNAGLISGDVDLGANDDTYTGIGDGVVVGTVMGEDGNDTLHGSSAEDRLDGGSGEDNLKGGGGSDALTGGGENDYIMGDADQDTITGDSGDDTIFGGTGDDEIDGGADNDNIRGGSGDDTVNGSDGNDVLRGSSGNDIVDGGANNDKLYGGAGDDEIIGGTGKDVMRGNAGADTFVFQTEFDANTTDAVDRIRDFEQGIDKIDISAIAGFEFIGDSSFSGTGSEVRYQTTGSGLRFEIDVDGDGVADMRINVNSISELLESDFIL